MKFRLALAATASLVLAACGSADDASTESEADTVEIPANDALEDVTATPVPDESATVEAPATEDTAAADEQAKIQQDSDNAAATAAQAADAMVDE